VFKFDSKNQEIVLVLKLDKRNDKNCWFSALIYTVIMVKSTVFVFKFDSKSDDIDDFMADCTDVFKDTQS